MANIFAILSPLNVQVKIKWLKLSYQTVWIVFLKLLVVSFYW